MSDKMREAMTKPADPVSYETWMATVRECNEAKEEARRLREAMEFYADPRRYQGPNQNPIPNDQFAKPDAVYIMDVSRDNGSIARAALQATPSRPVSGEADIIDGIAKTIWLAEFGRAFSRTPTDPWENQAEPIKEGHRNTARKLIEAGYGPAVSPQVLCAWLPIETAPRDGTLIDLLFRGGMRFTDCAWFEDQWWTTEQDEPSVCVSHGSSQPTHWMPRPTLPRAERKAAS